MTVLTVPSGYNLVWSDEFNGDSIDTSKWDKDFQVHFNIIIDHAPIKKYAERMKYYIKEDYGNFSHGLSNTIKINISPHLKDKSTIIDKNENEKKISIVNSAGNNIMTQNYNTLIKGTLFFF